MTGVRHEIPQKVSPEVERAGLKTVNAIEGLSLVTAVGISLTLLATGNAFAYTFTKIADTSGPFGSFGGSAIADTGTVVFDTTLKVGGRGIFTGSGEATTNIVNGPFSVFGINNEGTVGFNELMPGSSGIFTINSGVKTTIAVNSGPLSVVAFPALNNEGTVAFRGYLGGDTGIFTSNGGAITAIADTSGPFSFFGGINPAINDSGTVAFEAVLKAGGNGVFTSSNGATTTIADTSGPFGFVGDLALNSNTVAFEATLKAGGSGIFAGSSGAITTIADSSGPLEFLGTPVINDRSTVAFDAFLKAGGRGIFTGPDPVADEVIATGDTLLGSTVRSVRFPGRGLNNSGQIAFIAQLANGTEGVFRANPDTPKPVPEPTSLFGLLMVIALGAGWQMKLKIIHRKSCE